MRELRAILSGVGLVGAVLALPEVAVAEVMDKEPTLAVIWTWALVGGALGFVGWHFRWWLGAGLGLLAASYFVALYSEMTDPYVGPAIMEEAERGYVRWSYCAAAVFVILHVAGVWHSLRGRGHVAS